MINRELLPALTGREFTEEQPERILISLPARLGGLAIPVLRTSAADEYLSSWKVTGPVVDMIATGNGSRVPYHKAALQAIGACRDLIRSERASRKAVNLDVAKSLMSQVSSRERFTIATASEKGVSSWLTVDPSPLHGTVLNKSDFRDAVGLRYGYSLDGLPTRCVCGEAMTIDHAFACPCGGMPDRTAQRGKRPHSRGSARRIS